MARNPDWYKELYSLIEQRFIASGLPNVGPAFGKTRSRPSVEPWIAGLKPGDPEITDDGGVGGAHMLIFGGKVTVCKSDVDGGAMLQAWGLIGQVEASILSWQIPVVGVIRPKKLRRRDAPQAQHESSLPKEYNSDGDSVFLSLFYIHLYVDQWEVIK